MSNTNTTFELNEDQLRRAETLVEPALAFVDSAAFPLGYSMIRRYWRDGGADDVIAALIPYQQPDGGFSGLEVDIKAPVSNPFATRLAMHVLMPLSDSADDHVLNGIKRWLTTAQAADGDWHFSPRVYEDELAPWFAGWTFPSLNPACCLAGLGTALGVITDPVRERVEGLFTQLASKEEASSGAFYNLLPYVEYCERAGVPDLDSWLDAIASNIVATDAAGGYQDAGHFLDHALGSGPALVSRLPAATLAKYADLLLDEADADGGWPTPYNDGWRPWLSAQNMTLLAKLRDGV